METTASVIAKYGNGTEGPENGDLMAGKEYIWGCTLTEEKSKESWLMEDEDEKDFLTHTLFLKHAVLGVNSVKGERNVVQVTTKNSASKELVIPIISLTLGQTDSTFLDLCFGNDCPAEFKLVEGTGPVCLIGQESIEYPFEDSGDISQDEEAFEEAEEVGTEEEDEDVPAKPSPAAVAASKKRKAQPVANGKAKKGKLDNATEESDEEMASGEDEVDDEDDDEVEDQDEEDDDEEGPSDEEEDSSPEKKKKAKGKKPQAKAKPAAKAVPKKDVKAAKPAKKVPAKKAKK